MSPKDPQYFQKAIRYLSYRSRSTKEMQDHLASKDASSEEIEKIIHRLEELGYMDDDDFADQLISSYRKRFFGPKKLYFNLLNKGIDRVVIKKKLADVESVDWQEPAKKYLEKKKLKWQSLEGFKQNQKMYQLLAGRGYVGVIIKIVIDDVLHQE